MELAEKLARAREKLGLTLYKAAVEIGIERMLLVTLEGRNPIRKGGGVNVRLCTAIAVIDFYWPVISLADFGIGENLVIGRLGADGKVRVPKQ